MRRPTLSVALGCIGLAAAAATADARPVVLAEQDGFIRQVDRWANTFAWTRCVSPTGPSEVWVRSAITKQTSQLPGLTTEGTCDGQQLLGMTQNQIALTVRGVDGLSRVTVAPVDGGPERVLEQESNAGAKWRITAADAYGPLVTWVRMADDGPNWRVQLVTTDFRVPNPQPTVVWQTAQPAGRYRIDGVWQSGDGSVLMRQVSLGPAPTYSTQAGPVTTSVLVRRRTDSTMQTISSVRGAIRIADADIDRDHVMWSLIRTDSNSSWVYHRDLTRNVKRILSVRANTVRPSLRVGPAYPTVAVQGPRGAWHMRQRSSNRTFIDRMWGEGLQFGRRTNLNALPDTVRQEVFQSPPAVWGRFAQWAVTRYTGPSGWQGGYTGLSGHGARSQVVVAAIR